MNSTNHYPNANDRNNSKPKVYKLLKKKNTLSNDNQVSQNKENAKNESLNIKKALNTTTYGVYKQTQGELRDRILEKLNDNKANINTDFKDSNNIQHTNHSNYSPPINNNNSFYPFTVKKESSKSPINFGNHLRTRSTNLETNYLPSIKDNYRNFNLKEKQLRYGEYISNNKTEPYKINYSSSKYIKNDKSFISLKNKNDNTVYHYQNSQKFSNSNNNNKRGNSLNQFKKPLFYNNQKKINVNLNITDDNSNSFNAINNNSFNNSIIKRPNDPFKRTLSSDPDNVFNNQNGLNSISEQINSMIKKNDVRSIEKKEIKNLIDTRKFSILDIGNHSNLAALQLQSNKEISKNNSLEVYSSNSINENEIHNPFMSQNTNLNVIDDIYNLNNLNQFKIEHENFEKLNSLSQYQTNLLIQLKNTGLNIDLSAISKMQFETKISNSVPSNKISDTLKQDSNSLNMNRKKTDLTNISNNSNINVNVSKIIPKARKSDDNIFKRDDESIFCKTLLTEMISRKAIKIRNNINSLKDNRLKAIYIAMESNMLGITKKIKLIISIPSIFNMLKDYLLKNTISAIQFYIKQIDDKIGNKESIRDELSNWSYKPSTSTLISYNLINKEFEKDLIKNLLISKEVDILFKIILIVFSVEEQISNENTMIKIYSKYKTDGFSKFLYNLRKPFS